MNVEDMNNDDLLQRLMDLAVESHLADHATVYNKLFDTMMGVKQELLHRLQTGKTRGRQL